MFFVVLSSEHRLTEMLSFEAARSNRPTEQGRSGGAGI